MRWLSFRDLLVGLSGMLALQAIVPVQALANVCDGTTNGQQATDCTAYKDDLGAAEAAEAGMAVWGVVAGVCGYACVAATYAKPVLDSVCVYSDIGGAVADIGLTLMLSKNMSSNMSELGGLLGVAMTSAMELKAISTSNQVLLAANKEAAKSLTQESQVAADQQGTKKTHDSCMSAAMAVIQVGLKAMTMEESNSQAKQDLANATAITPPAPENPNFDSVPQASAAPEVAKRFIANVASSAGTGVARSPGAMIEAATAGNPALANLMANPNTAQQFQQASGMPMGNYLTSAAANSGNAGAVVGQAMAALPNAPAIAVKANDIEKSIADLMEANPELKYASHHAAPASGDGEGDPMSKMMADMMSKLMPKQAAEKDPEMQKLEFLLKNQDPASLAENRSVSLFTRVDYRYRQSADLVEAGRWASSYNAAVANRGPAGMAAH